jgi:hypothetical protein
MAVLREHGGSGEARVRQSIREQEEQDRRQRELKFE